tara:strand:- start:3060 stop:4292 length:1233 start_codon:yes stop_codon:yes gene_type:complete
MSKLKIAFLSYRSDPFSGGQGIYLKNLCEALINRNHDITIFSGNPLPNVPENIRLIEIETPGYFETFTFKERVKIFSQLSKSRMDYLDFFETCTGTFTEPIFFGERLSANKTFAEEAHTFDIFHDNQSLSNYPKIINRRLITTLHHPIHIDRDIDLEMEKDFFMRLAIRRWYSFLGFQKNNIKNIKSIISPSESSKSDIKKFFNCPEEKINVIWNGIDLSDHKLSTRVGFNANLVTIISSDVPMKNLKTIIKAIALVSNEIPDIKLTIIGDLRKGNEELIKKLDLRNNIVFKNKLTRSELVKTLNNSDIGISGSLYEGFGFPLVEMISTGLPVIVSNKGSLPELAGNAGLMFDATSPSDLADKIRDLVNENDLRQKLIDNAKIRRDDFFGWDEYAKRLETVYRSIIRGNI